MKRLFLFCRTFSSKVQFIEWMKVHLQDVIKPIHLSLIEIFCYTQSEIDESVDELIAKSEDKDLLAFIQTVLDRSLLWYDPAQCYPSDFEDVLREANEHLKIGIKHPLRWVNNPQVDGVSFRPTEEYMHVFYKYQNLVKGIVKGELYYEIKDLSKQAYLTLLKSMSLFFENSYKLTFFDEENWERKFNEIAKKETDWCKFQIRKG